MFKRLISLAILAALLYYGYTVGLPWLETMGKGGGAGGSGGSSGESHQCVAEARAASDTISGELLPNARPPVDSGVWGTALVRGGRVLAAAETACSCPTAACARGYDAVQELRAMFDELDDIARGNPAGIGNPARRQERVDRLLDEARAAAAAE